MRLCTVLELVLVNQDMRARVCSELKALQAALFDFMRSRLSTLMIIFVHATVVIRCVVNVCCASRDRLHVQNLIAMAHFHAAGKVQHEQGHIIRAAIGFVCLRHSCHFWRECDHCRQEHVQSQSVPALEQPSADASKCQAFTNSGRQCTRNIAPGRRKFCNQHGA